MKVGWQWIAAFAVFVACIPLLAWDHNFFGDWPNHLGMIGYFGEHLKVHGALPAVFNTNETVGRATPLFYGQLCWPALGLLSAFVGPRAALSLTVAGLLVLQFASVRALVRTATSDEATACATATVVTWAIYPLTDLYNRAAIPEFLAITSLQAGMCLWVRYARDPARFDGSSVGAGLLVTTAIGAHPPTALAGGITFGLVWAAALWFSPDRRRVVARALPIAAAGALVLAPWVYVVARFRPHLKIVRNDSSLWWFHSSLDAVGTRLSPLPTVGPDPTGMSTPYLDAQVSLPIMASLVACAIAAAAARGRDRMATRALAFGFACTAIAAVVLIASVSAPSWRLLPKAFEAIQFPYRLVAFVNMAMLMALVGMLAALPGGELRTALRRRILAGAFVLAAAGIGCKVPRCLASSSGQDAAVTDYSNPPRDTYFGSEDYATLDAFGRAGGDEPKQVVKLPVGGPLGFGVAGPGHVQLASGSRVVTNVQPFPWNELTVDGHPVARNQTVVEGGRLATWVDAGAHDLGYRFRPARLWKALRTMALAIVAAWTLVAFAWPAMRARRAGLAPTPPSADDDGSQTAEVVGSSS